VGVADVVAVHVGDQHHVDLAQARVVGAGDGAARVVEHARAARVFEDQGAVERAELALLAAQRRDLDVLRERGMGEQRSERQRAEQ
jgi:hypothetical protein